MKIEIWKDGWLLAPETEFERDVMRSFGTGGIEVFHKYGATPSQDSYLGIKIKPTEKSQNTTKQ